ncbi:hypothetical protein KSF_004430 [Reticulibacter mediterranei]|uniref:Tetratricopeptide repeat protein n=1 Tax=Reticulibacter mediterranei TaxID=2778369 RepID=A0A8J3IDE6_9CHLR|nr:hypothetical protein KSF_004430 [Reticulibacter mediterranei]
MYRKRGSVYHSLKEYQRALADYHHALELNPEYTVAYTSRSLVHLPSGYCRAQSLRSASRISRAPTSQIR